MERIALVISVCVVVGIILPGAVYGASPRLRGAIHARLTTFLEREKARDVYHTTYDFTTSISARSLTEAIERRWGRTIPSGEPQFYVHNVFYELQVILAFGNQTRPQVLSARIDFESRDPARGILGFWDAHRDDPTEVAAQFRSDFVSLINDLSPGSALRERKEDVVIATYTPEQYEAYRQRKPGQHRRRNDRGS